MRLLEREITLSLRVKTTQNEKNPTTKIFVHFGAANAAEFSQGSTSQSNRTEGNFIKIRCILQVMEAVHKLRSVLHICQAPD